MADKNDDLMSLADIAEVMGLAFASVRTYHTDATRRRREGHPRDQDMPTPDVVMGPWPRWKPETIAEWAETRQRAQAEHAERLRAPRGPRSAA